MAEPKYSYRTTSFWTGKRSGLVKAQTVPEVLNFSAPPEFEGTPGVWTPEHMLVGAVGACFITTFRAIADVSHFDFKRLEVEVTGTLEKTPEGLRFTQVIIKPELTLDEDTHKEQAFRLLEKAKRNCLISRSLSAETVLDPQVHTLYTSAVVA
jgi:peroxiredoxin-like protein